jgi:hypothetical protein
MDYVLTLVDLRHIEQNKFLVAFEVNFEGQSRHFLSCTVTVEDGDVLSQSFTDYNAFQQFVLDKAFETLEPKIEEIKECILTSCPLGKPFVPSKFKD